MTLTNSQQINCHAGISVYFTHTSGQQGSRILQPDASIVINPTSSHSGGTLEIHYSSANAGTHQITRPLIIVEGFDPWKLTTNDPRDNLNFDYFWLLNELGFYGATLKNLLENNYDIIYIDYNDGTDAIERNAALVTDAINQVNVLKANAGSTQKNVVLGFSMGGLVARYALRQMEINSQVHDARLFISYDAPYLGANVPLGLQALNAHLANVKIKIGYLNGTFGYVTTVGNLVSALKVYSTPAAQQLLKYYVRNSSGTLSMDNSVHNTFVSTLSGMGYPQQTRKVAVANGSECAISLPLLPGSDLLRFSGHYNTTFLGSLLFPGGLLGFDTNFPQFLLGIFPGRNDLKCNFKVKTTPSSGSIEVYNGKISYQKKFYGIININTTLTSNAYTNPSGLFPLDAYPGGQYDVNQVGRTVQNGFNGSFGTSFWQQLINGLVKRGVDEL